MKIAGRKNDGAWYRTNQFIQDIKDRTDITDALVTVITGIDSLAAFCAAMADLGQKTGVPVPEDLSNPANYAITLASTGIPRQVWQGVLSYDTYTKTGTGAAAKYKPDHAAEAREFAGDLRAAVTRFIFGAKELYDIENSNPNKKLNKSGLANASKAN